MVNIWCKIWLAAVFLLSTNIVFAENGQKKIKITKGLSVKLYENSFSLEADKNINANSQFVSDPPRYVIDVPEFDIPRPISFKFPNHPNFSALRSASHEGFVRIVIDLKNAPITQPQFSETSNSVNVDFTPYPGAVPLIEPPSSIEIAELPEAEQTIELTETEEEESDEPAEEQAIVIPDAEQTVAAPAVEQAEVLPEIPEKVQQPDPVIAANLPEVPKPEEAKPEVKEPIKLPENIELRFSISDLIVNLPYNNRPIRDVTVKNRSETPLFMTAFAEQVFNAGLPEERREPAKALLVSPRRFELAPGKERLVRLVIAARDDTSEAVFRVNFIPDTEPFNPEKMQPNQLAINTGISALVLIEPKTPEAKLVTAWEESELILENEGNTNIFLDRIKLCGAGQCEGFPAKRLYANAKWKIPAKDLTSVEFLQKIGEDFENIALKRP